MTKAPVKTSKALFFFINRKIIIINFIFPFSSPKIKNFCILLSVVERILDSTKFSNRLNRIPLNRLQAVIDLSSIMYISELISETIVQFIALSLVFEDSTIFVNSKIDNDFA